MTGAGRSSGSATARAAGTPVVALAGQVRLDAAEVARGGLALARAVAHDGASLAASLAAPGPALAATASAVAASWAPQRA